MRVREAGIDFIAPLGEGQKTGWFYDQVANRALLGRFLPAGARVLDVCSYVGAWGITALRHGAARATCVDGSATALEFAQRNATAAGYALETLRGDAFDVLKNLHETGERFDAVILDPPAFIKRRKDIPQGQAAYRKLNQLAMNLIGRDGLLVSCSCSYHLEEEQLVTAVQAGRPPYGAICPDPRLWRPITRSSGASGHPRNPLSQSAVLSRLARVTGETATISPCCNIQGSIRSP